jgi:PadR family transcriptional regulator PadR
MTQIRLEIDNLKDLHCHFEAISLRGLPQLRKDSSFEEGWKVEMRRGLLEYAILAVVRRHQEGIHGYGIVRELKERAEGLFEVQEGTLYPILHRLKKERLLNVHTEKSGEGPSRLRYVLTGEGDRVYRTLSVMLANMFAELEELK